MGSSPDKGGAGGSSTHHVRPGGRRRCMPVYDGAMCDQEGGEGVMATGGGGSQGGERTRQCGKAIVVGECLATVDDNGEDDGGGRRYQATNNNQPHDGDDDGSGRQ
jgi:hypothetical protein